MLADPNKLRWLWSVGDDGSTVIVFRMDYIGFQIVMKRRPFALTWECQLRLECRGKIANNGGPRYANVFVSKGAKFAAAFRPYYDECVLATYAGAAFT